MEHALPLAERPLILVVDDQALMRKMLRGALQAAGFMVETAASGEEALALCTTITPDLIILDAMMEGMDGFATCVELRRRPEFEYLPILMMTLLNSSESILHAFEVGVTDFISKPINSELLIFRIRFILKAFVTVRALQASKEHLVATQILAKIADWEWHPATNRFDLSAQMRRLLQRPLLLSDDLDGFLALLHPDDVASVREGFLRLRREGGELSIECRIVGEDGQHRHLHLRSQYHSALERLSPVIGTIQDVTEQHHLQEEASRATHLAALGELSAGIGHEINNPTGVILLDLPIVQKAFDDIAPLLEEHYRLHGAFPFAGLPYPEMRDEIPVMLDEVVENAQRIKRIVDELRDFARPIDPGQTLLPVDLNLVVMKAQRLAAHQIKSATDHFRIDYADHDVKVAGEFYKLEQVVINLLLNACQALPERSRGLHVSVTTAENRHLLIVEDEGRGIPPEQLAMITSPFFTTRRNEGGTGLGLSVSARIIEEHGGQLHFTSTPGQGTRVVVSLPIWHEEEKE